MNNEVLDLWTVLCADLARAFAAELPTLDPRDASAVFAELEHLTGEPEPIRSIVLTGFIEMLVHADASNGGGFNFGLFAYHVGPRCRRYIRAYGELTGATTRGFETV